MGSIKSSYNKYYIDCLLQIGTHRESGQSCKIYMESFVNIFGEWKVVACTGFKEVGVSLGKID